MIQIKPIWRKPFKAVGLFCCKRILLMSLKANTLLDYSKKRGKIVTSLRFCSCQVELEGDLHGSKTKEV